MTYAILCASDYSELKMITMGVEVPYGSDELVQGDLWQCPTCGIQVLSGFGLPYPKDPEVRREFFKQQ